MTDKQIIINKMDKPKRYCEGIDCAWCNEKEPCIYKIANELEEKLLRKEQEYEELKKIIMYKSQCGEEYLSPIGASLYEENNKLKAENEELKAEKVKYYQQTLDDEIQINELLQTLAEIKKIAETISLPMGTGKSGNRVILAKQILQKISEVEECKP